MQKKKKVKTKSEMKLCISGLFFPYFPPYVSGMEGPGLGISDLYQL